MGTGFNTKSMRELFDRFAPLKQPECPFVDLPQPSKGRWGQGLTAADMRSYTWVEPKLVCQVQFAEWTEGGHLRHASFKELRDDKEARQVVQER